MTTHVVSYSELDRLPLIETPCVIYPGKPSKHGHGIVDVGDLIGDGKRHRTTDHNAVWWRANGPIPAGYVIHHVCEVKLCINLGHLMLLTRAVHTRLHHLTNRCKRGHIRTSASTWVAPKTGIRHCKLCWPITERARKRDRKRR